MSRNDRTPRPHNGIDAWIARLITVWRSMNARETGTVRNPDLTTAEISRLTRALRELTRGLDARRNLAGAGYMNRADTLGAYLLYFWPVSYAQTRCCLSHAGFAPPPRAWNALDLGSGPGPAAFALADLGAAAVTCADQSGPALDTLARLATHTRTRITVERWDGAKGAPIPRRGAPYDCIVAGHLLNELWRGAPDRIARRAALVRSALELLTPDGVLLAFEPALRTTSRELLAVRDVLAAEGAHVVAPCTMTHPCPALADPQATCHAAAPWHAPRLLQSIAQAAGPHREALKMAYVAFRRTPQSPPRPSLYRVVSEPMRNKAGRVRVIICGDRGRFSLSADPRERTDAVRAFLSVKRSDLLEITAPQDRGDTWGVGPGTQLTVLPPCPIRT